MGKEETKVSQSHIDLVQLVNRWRSQGYKYLQIYSMLKKMGITEQETNSVINEYVKDTCGVSWSGGN